MRTFAFLYNRTIGLGSHNTPVLYVFKILSNPRRSLKNFLGLITVIAKAIEQFEKKNDQWTSVIITNIHIYISQYVKYPVNLK